MEQLAVCKDPMVTVVLPYDRLLTPESSKHSLTLALAHQAKHVRGRVVIAVTLVPLLGSCVCRKLVHTCQLRV